MKKVTMMVEWQEALPSYGLLWVPKVGGSLTVLRVVVAGSGRGLVLEKAQQ